jgi:hypothetical protein
VRIKLSPNIMQLQQRPANLVGLSLRHVLMANVVHFVFARAIDLLDTQVVWYVNTIVVVDVAETIPRNNMNLAGE